MKGICIGPYPSEDRVVACNGWEGKIGALGIEDAEEPLHVAVGRFEKVPDLPEVGGGGYGEDLAEDATVTLAAADEGEGALEVLGDLGDDAADGALVEGLGGGGGGAHGGAEVVAEQLDLLGEFGAVHLGRLGLLGEFYDSVA